ncbi:lysosomal pro-x carboxypeptidase [Phtheirospermum japonicum]|uniref:Lysosomal pro-x carboxypeptidase n=1 Tax=Phtheirospermum japonicum TaxID=374723 RepID=A0A830BG51_9LAMI|nr:lysosomal pro-x carboxypeptidase [Phtheirospermum japonicum]
MFQFYPFFFSLLLLQTVSTLPQKSPRLSLHYKHTSVFGDSDHSFSHGQSTLSNNFTTFYYNQILDHFNYAPQSYATFNQKYVINSEHWGGPNSPIFAYLGDEVPLGDAWNYIGFLNDNAPKFKALCVYIEHRYYGDSNPFGSMKKAMDDNTTRGYLNSAQALADFAEILLHIKNKYLANNSPIIVFGGSYGGMLASWFRLKYPHIVLGALASSAPILYFDNITPQNGYYSIVSKDFENVSKSCYQTIQKSWDEITKVASKPNGLSILSQKFNTCSPLNKYEDLWDYLQTMYLIAAQYDAPSSKYPVQRLCKGIDGAPNRTDILGSIFAGVVSYEGNECLDTTSDPSETSIGWGWQSCSEMVMPIGVGKNEMFQASPFNLTDYINNCQVKYGVEPRPHWITTFYGGNNIELVLKRFGSNIIFSNGLRDPYSSGGVLKNLSETIVAVTTDKGSHGLDILRARENDPEWLIMQRRTEAEIISKWLTTYYDDLRALK